MQKLQKFKRFVMPAAVFLTGACVLVIELVATRVLAPYFGNTIFSVTSVISVVLAALSLGYYIGGRLADKYPSTRLFFGLITAAGAAVLIVYWMQLSLLPFLGGTLSLTTGPLITSIIMYFLPGFVLGMLSPFAVKLQQRAVQTMGVGSVAGEIFFYSTLGSIAGSLLTGYVLIPNFGTRAIVMGVAAVLLVLGIVPLVVLKAEKKFLTKLSVLLVLLLAATWTLQPPVRAVYEKDGVYEKVQIIDGWHDGKPTRFLYQDRSASGAMYLHSDDLVYEYTKYYALHELFLPDGVRRALCIGGGAYSVPKALLKDAPFATVDAAEIEPGLVELGEKYFNTPQDNPRFNHYIADGRRLLRDAPEPYDYIFSDVYYSLYSIPTHFTTKEFFEEAYNKLTPGGVFIANIIGSKDQQEPSLLYAEIRTLQSVFPNVYVFAVEGPDVDRAQNMIVVAHKSEQRLVFNTDAIRSHTNPIIRDLSAHALPLDSVNFARYPVLTDNYAPVESWTATLLRRQQ